MKEYKAIKKSELREGELQTVTVDDQKILIIKIDDNVHAYNAVCPHYGANLGEGACDGKRLVCPWHHATFELTSGQLLEPPAMDGLAAYEVREDGDDIIILVPDEMPVGEKPQMARSDPGKDSRKFVILGAGAAGQMAAQTLREDGFEGQILMLTKDNKLPYDRPNLSKQYLQGEAKDEWMPLRPAEFYDQADIEVRTGVRVTAVDTERKSVRLENGDEVDYDGLLLALGGRPRTLSVDGADLDGIHTLRSFEDADTIIAGLESAQKVLVVGAGFIGMETAFSAKQRGPEVTVVAPENEPLAGAFGDEIGSLFKKRHEEAGIQFRLGRNITRLEGNDTVRNAILDDNSHVDADLVLVGIGVEPASDVIKGIMFERDGSVRVDRYLEAYGGVHVAGDIAYFPDWRTGRHTRIEHWRTAQQQGRVAAHNMLGRKAPYESVPFFWTTQAGLHFRYVGHAPDWDEIIVDGDVSAADFVAYFVKDGKVLAVAGNNRDKELAAAELLMSQDNLPAPDELRSGRVRLDEQTVH